MDYKKSYTVLKIAKWVGLPLMLLGLLLDFKEIAAGTALLWSGAVLVVGGTAQTLLFYKCPDCGRGFSIRDQKPKCCPGCGRTLDL